MQQNIKELYRHKLAASDGDIGHVKDFYFDDQTWVIRYMVVETGKWLSGREVLLSPHAFGHFDRIEKILSVNLTRKQIEDSPPVDLHSTISRQYETDYYRHYGWPPYWSGTAMWGLGGFPVVVPPSRDQMQDPHQYHHRTEKHLQSMKTVTGYEVLATDGKFGAVSGFMVDDKSWAISALVADTGRWYSDKEVLIATGKIERISYEESNVIVKLSKAAIEQAAIDTRATVGV